MDGWWMGGCLSACTAGKWIFTMGKGQVRSECLTCTFRASCCSAHLSRAQVPAFASSSVRDMGKGLLDGLRYDGWVSVLDGLRYDGWVSVLDGL